MFPLVKGVSVHKLNQTKLIYRSSMTWDHSQNIVSELLYSLNETAIKSALKCLAAVCRSAAAEVTTLNKVLLVPCNHYFSLLFHCSLIWQLALLLKRAPFLKQRKIQRAQLMQLASHAYRCPRAELVASVAAIPEPLVTIMPYSSKPSSGTRYFQNYAQYWKESHTLVIQGRLLL